jgi:hydrogenase maturation protein HypF
VRALRPDERKVIGQMLRTGFRSPQTSSAGRLFDGVAALLDLHQQVSFEGQAAMALEFAADDSERGAYPIIIDHRRAASLDRNPLVLDWVPLLTAVVADLRRGVGVHIMAGRFHNSLVDLIVEVARTIDQSPVALTGGCFQNRLLTERTANRLRSAGFEVLLHRQVPPNDGGISLGQVAVAAARLQTSTNQETEG